MLIELSITNYRSLKNKTTLSLVADGYESKSENINQYKYPNNKKLRLHNTVLIFGPNGSGKSNLIRGMFYFMRMLKTQRHEGDELFDYDPFKFDYSSRNAVSTFEIKFLDEDQIPYLYKVSFDKVSIQEESLVFWPNGREAEVFTRVVTNKSDKVHIIKIGQAAQEDSKEEKIYKNNFGLSHFSSLTPNEKILKAFNAIKKIKVVNNLNDDHRKKTSGSDLGRLLYKDKNFRRKINALVRFSDLNIDSIKATPKKGDSSTKNKKKYLFEALHQVFRNGKATDQLLSIPLEEESQGSQTIIGLGSEIILSLEEGATLLVDEFETSLHPNLSKALIRIFQSERLNPKKAQLIFTTHDTNLMDHLIFRRDQIWFTEKNHHGETELFSMVDFENLREGHVFEKWYLSGKFGALPHIDSIEMAFG